MGTVISNEFGVDAGNIGIIDMDFVKENGGEFGKTAKRMSQQIAVKPGNYLFKYNLPDTWLGEIKGEITIKTKGDVVIGDICYLFSDVKHEIWLDFLEKTGYLKNLGSDGFAINTGGDGCFPAIFEFSKI